MGLFSCLAFLALRYWYNREFLLPCRKYRSNSCRFFPFTLHLLFKSKLCLVYISLLLLSASIFRWLLITSWMRCVTRSNLSISHRNERFFDNCAVLSYISFSLICFSLVTLRFLSRYGDFFYEVVEFFFVKFLVLSSGYYVPSFAIHLKWLESF